MSDMISNGFRYLVLLLMGCVSVLAAEPVIMIAVDVREINRSLVHARLEIPVQSGHQKLWYPKWIPGVHAPSGPSENIGGLRFETIEGQAIEWKRDDEEFNCFHLDVPNGVSTIVVNLDYICNQSSVNSHGVDNFGNELLGVFSWNTVLLYPEDTDIDKTKALLKVQLPPEWAFGTALKTSQQEKGSVSFLETTLRTFVDSPMICGERIRTIEITSDKTPPAFIHIVSESSAALQIEEPVIKQLRSLVAEAVSAFGGARWKDFHFLVVCSDRLPGNGLEHLSSSLNVIVERGLVDEVKRTGWPAYLLPHEFVHSWCGKFRRPKAMVTSNFHTPEKTRLLWVYEGLTQYMGEVLAVRSGLMPLEKHIDKFQRTVQMLIHQDGRRWRSLEDTAIATWQLRGTSPNWEALRRRQDYYQEGALVWMEADALIRLKSDGKKSLDDFCQKFFAAGNEAAEVLSYELPEIISELRLLADLNWEQFFSQRISKTRDELNLEWFGKLGYQLQYEPEPGKLLLDIEKETKIVSLQDSLGLTVGDDGRILVVVPRSPADNAGLSNRFVIKGVNGQVYTGVRLKEAVAESVSKGLVKLLVLDGDLLREISIPYKEGSRYLHMKRVSSSRDVFGEIMKPRIKG